MNWNLDYRINHHSTFKAQVWWYFLFYCFQQILWKDSMSKWFIKSVELIATDRVGKSESMQRWTNTVLFFVYSWDLFTIWKISNNSSIILWMVGETIIRDLTQAWKTSTENQLNPNHIHHFYNFRSISFLKCIQKPISLDNFTTISQCFKSIWHVFQFWQSEAETNDSPLKDVFIQASVGRIHVELSVICCTACLQCKMILMINRSWTSENKWIQ